MDHWLRVRLILSVTLLASTWLVSPASEPGQPDTLADVLVARLIAPTDYPDGAAIAMRLSLQNRGPVELALPRPRFGSAFSNVQLNVNRITASGERVPLRRLQQELAVTDLDRLKLPAGARAGFKFNLRRHFDFTNLPAGDFELVARLGLDVLTEARQSFAVIAREQSQSQVINTPVFPALLQLRLWEPDAVPGSIRHQVFVSATPTGTALFYRLLAPGFPEDIVLSEAPGLAETRLAYASRPVEDRFYNRSLQLLGDTAADAAIRSGQPVFAADRCAYVAVVARFDDGSLRLWTIGRCSPLPSFAPRAGDDWGYLDAFATGVSLSSEVDRILSVSPKDGQIQIRFETRSGQTRTVSVNELGPVP